MNSNEMIVDQLVKSHDNAERMIKGPAGNFDKTIIKRNSTNDVNNVIINPSKFYTIGQNTVRPVENGEQNSMRANM